MNKTVWNTLLNVIIAVASAILGAIGDVTRSLNDKKGKTKSLRPPFQSNL